MPPGKQGRSPTPAQGEPQLARGQVPVVFHTGWQSPRGPGTFRLAASRLPLACEELTGLIVMGAGVQLSKELQLPNPTGDGPAGAVL